MPGLDPGIHQSSQESLLSDGLPGQDRQRRVLARVPLSFSPCVLGDEADADGNCFLEVDTALILLASTKTDGHA
jgi:hypothetical protein